MKSYSAIIQMKATQRAGPSCGAVYYAVQGGSSLLVSG